MEKPGVKNSGENRVFSYNGGYRTSNQGVFVSDGGVLSSIGGVGTFSAGVFTYSGGVGTSTEGVFVSYWGVRGSTVLVTSFGARKAMKIEKLRHYLGFFIFTRPKKTNLETTPQPLPGCYYCAKRYSAGIKSRPM